MIGMGNRKKGKPIRWRKLDNAAKLFPAVANEKENHVFRISVTLKEEVNPKILSRALEEILPKFDTFRVKLRRGIFWFYFEENHQKPQIEKENFYPCQFLDTHRNQNFLFRVSYFQNRINLEVFHVLTDGLGAVTFLKELIYCYLELERHGENFVYEPRGLKLLPEDSYVKNYKKMKKQSYSTARAYQIKGKHKKFDAIDVTHGYIDLKDLKQVSKTYGVSITKYLAAVLIFSIYQTANVKQKNVHPIVINIPVNLREFFDSETTSNFFAVIMVEFFPEERNYTLNDIIHLVSMQMDEKISRKNIEEILSYNVAAERNPVIRVLPLFIKNIGIRFMFRRSRRSVTATLSNLGRMEIDPEYSSKLQRFHAMMGVFSGQEFKCTVISYLKEVVVTFTSVFQETKVQDMFFDILQKEKIKVTTQNNKEKPEKGGIYPDVEPRKKYLRRISTVFLFVSFALVGMLVGINYLTYQGFWWSIIASAGIFYLVFLMFYSIVHRGNPAAKILAGTLGTNLLMSVIDMTLGNSGWSFSYASPGMVMMANAAIFVLVLANRKNWHSYVVYQAILTVCNLLMNGFYITGWIKNPLVLWISCGLSVIMTIILMVSGHRKGMKELKRRFYA